MGHEQLQFYAMEFAHRKIKSSSAEVVMTKLDKTSLAAEDISNLKELSRS
jgi:hypothetical protein